MVAKDIDPQNTLDAGSPSEIKFKKIDNSFQLCVKSVEMVKIMKKGYRGPVLL
jgi:hypothetical protein